MKMINKSITIIIKPTDACNLRCEYCYNNNSLYSNERMDLGLFESLLSLLCKEYQNIKFIWHGGEPLLMGIDFYYKVIEIQEKYNNVFHNSIQTNGTLITDEYAHFFVKNHFSIGISFDGDFNDMPRKGYKEALKGIEVLLSNGLRPSILSTINAKNLNHLSYLYDFFKRLSLPWKFNKIFSSGEALNNDSLLVDYDKYIDSLKSFFDLWFNDINCNIYVSTFMVYVKLFFGLFEQCEFSSCLFKYLAIDARGTLYPCGRNYGQDWILGNIVDFQSVNNIFKSDKYRKLISSAVERRNKCLADCNLFQYCQGGCNNNAIISGKAEENNFNECLVFKEIIPYIFNKLSSIKDWNDESINPYIKKCFNTLNKVL